MRARKAAASTAPPRATASRADLTRQSIRSEDAALVRYSSNHMVVRELWSDREEADLARFVGAAGAANLVAALHAIEGASEEDAAQDRALLAGWARRVEERLPRRG